MDRQQLLQHSLQLVQMQRIRSVGLRLRRIVVHLKKDAIDTRGHRSRVQAQE